MLAVGTLNTKIQLLENQGELKMPCCEIQKTVNTLIVSDRSILYTDQSQLSSGYVSKPQNC